MSRTECDVRSSQKVWCQVITKSVMSGHHKKCDVRSSQKVWRPEKNIQKFRKEWHFEWQTQMKPTPKGGIVTWCVACKFGEDTSSDTNFSGKNYPSSKRCNNFIDRRTIFGEWASYRHFYPCLISGASYRVP